MGAKFLPRCSPRRIGMVEPEMLRPEEARRDRGSQQDPESLALPNAGSAALKATTVTLPKLGQLCTRREPSAKGGRGLLS